MRLTFTLHCQARLYERAINVADIKQAIKNPDRLTYAFGERICVAKAVGKKTIEVIYFNRNVIGRSNEYVVITAYYL